MHRILVIDDEVRIRNILEEFLIKMGFEVLKASTAEEAIKLLNSPIAIDLMIVDIKMPNVARLDVLNEKKRLNNGAAVIILTGSIEVEKYLDDLKELGFTQNDIVYKPLDLFTLLDMVKKKLNIN